jgi:hypothetical protein
MITSATAPSTFSTVLDMLSGICADSARTTNGGAGADTFVFMGGDACHHGGEFRPTEYRPLPEIQSESLRLTIQQTLSRRDV